MSTKLHRSKKKKDCRETKQVRISRELHGPLRIMALNEGITLSRLLDGIVKAHFNIPDNA